MELQADGEKSDDSEELVAQDVSINDEDEQLREALYGIHMVYTILFYYFILFLNILRRPAPIRCTKACMGAPLHDNIHACTYQQYIKTALNAL